MTDDTIFQDFDFKKDESKKRRARNRCGSAQLLKDNEIPFSSHNSGAHLVVSPLPDITYDFWPGTGRFRQRGAARYGRGVFNLLAEIREHQRGAI